jgi:putative ABC transport system ATP-binding protein
MNWLLEAGPFSARDGEGRVLFADAVVRLPERSVVVLEGPSGSGKTTLLRRIAALDGAATEHRVLADEQYRSTRLPAWRARVTLLAQDAPTLPGSVRDNLEFPYRLKCAASARFDERQARLLLDRAGLDHIPLGRDAATLSGGERHRIAVVRGLLWDPPVLIADEPFSGVDPETATRCFELLLEHAHRERRALLVTLHHRRLGLRADRRLRLGDGRLETA